MEVLSPKGPFPYGGLDPATWARHQLRIAWEILDNPGGGLLFATQTIGQVKAALAGQAGWTELVDVLDQAEDLAVHRQYSEARQLLARALERFPAAGPA